MASLINRQNKKELLTEMVFKVNNLRYRLTRGLSPVIFQLEIEKNGKFKPTELLSSKKLNQEIIDKLISVDYALYKNIVGLNVSYNKPFLECSMLDKRNIIDNIFNIEVISKMLKNVKKRLSLNKIEQNLKLNDFNSFECQLESSNQFKNEINEKILNFEKEKEKEIKNLNISLNESKNKIDKLNLEILALEKENHELNISETINNKIEELKNNAKKYLDEKNELIAEAKLLNKQKVELEITPICPFCGTNLNSATHVQNHIKELKIKLINSKSLYEITSKKYNEISKELNELEVLNIKRINLLNGIKNKKEFKLIYESTLQNILKNIETVKNRVLDFDLIKIENDLLLLENNKINAKIEYDKITKDVINDTLLSKILNDSGIKSYFLTNMLPVLNSRINFYLSKFKFNFNITLNGELEPKIFNSRDTADYAQFSGGERKRIDISILLSFIDISKMISNWSCNVLFLDEIFDTGMDEDGLDIIINSLKETLLKNNDISINMITHKKINENVIWDYKYHIKKQIFSKIEEEKCKKLK